MLVYEHTPILASLRTADTNIVFLDTETTSLRPWRDGKIMAGLAIKPLGGESFYLPVRHAPWLPTESDLSAMGKYREKYEEKTLPLMRDMWGTSWTNAPEEEAVVILDYIRRQNMRVVMHNAKFDMAVCLQEGIDLSENEVFDTMVMARLCYEDEFNYGLKELSKKFIDENAGAAEAELKGLITLFKLPGYQHVHPRDMAPYAEKDLELTEALFSLFDPLIAERDLNDLHEVEKEITRVIFGIERRGFLLDVPFIQQAADTVRVAVADIERQMEEIAGEPVSVDNTKQIGRVFHSLGVKSTVKTPKGGESWDKIALATIDHPLAALITTCRTAKKILNSYYENFLELMDSDGVLHCSFQQSGTKTGRLSCREPNLQNIPRYGGFGSNLAGALSASIKKSKQEEHREKQLKLAAIKKQEILFDEELEEEAESDEGAILSQVRGSFVPRPGHVLLFFDWSQVELRIFADYADEWDLIKVFDIGLDVHRLSALSAFGSLPEDKDSIEYKWVRNMGKQIAFGLLYGMGVRLLAIEIRKSEAEAKEFMANYFARFRNARQFIDKVNVVVKRRGFIKNRWGRRRYIPANRAYVGVNFLIQGTAADLMKTTLVSLDRMLKDPARGGKARLISTIHDEAIIEAPYDEALALVSVVRNIMETSEKIRTKLRVDVEWAGTRWGEKHDLKCEVCDGNGQKANMHQDDILRMMYDGKELEGVVTISRCDECEGTGLDLHSLQDFIASQEAAS